MRLGRGRWALVAVAAAAPVLAHAQGGAECATVECARAGAPDTPPALRQLWDSAAAARAVKLEFVEAVQAFAVSQAGPAGHDPGSGGSHIAKMRDALARWDGAIQALETAARPHLRAADTHDMLGAVYLDRHRAADAVRALTEAARIDGDRAGVQVSLALAHALDRKGDEAARAWQRAAGLDPRNAAIALSLAQSLAALDRRADAVAARERFVRLRTAAPIGADGSRPAPPPPFERAGLFRPSAGLAPLFASARYAAAFARLETGDYAAAVEEMAAASAAEAGLAEEHRRGLESWVSGDHNAAVGDLRHAIELQPGEEKPRLALAFVLRAAGRPTEAEMELRGAAAAFPRSGLAWYRLGQLLESESRLPEAAQAFEASLERGPILGREAVYQRLARLRANQADFDGAIAAYAARVSVNLNAAEAHRSLGEIYYLQGRDDEALAAFLAAVWLDPNDARAHAALGKVHVRAGRYAEAVPVLRRAVALDATRADAHYALGQALARTGRAEDARGEMAAFQRLDAEERARGQRDFTIEQQRVDAARLVAQGDVAAALDVLRRLAEEDPQNHRWLREQGAALVRARRFAEAAAVLEAAQARNATVEGERLLADAYAGAGRAADARQALARYEEAMRQARLAQLLNVETGP